MGIKVARIFNTYGPRMDLHDGRVVSNFIFQALNNQPITVYGDGTQTRSFCYVDDLIRGLIALSQTSRDITGPINIGNPDEFSVLQLAKAVVELCGSKSIIEFSSLPSDDPKQRKPDLDLAKELLDWQPTTNLLTGLEKTIQNFKSRLE